MERCSQHLTFESFALSVQEKIESQGHRAKKKEREGERQLDRSDRGRGTESWLDRLVVGWIHIR